MKDLWRIYQDEFIGNSIEAEYHLVLIAIATLILKKDISDLPLY